MNEVRCSGCNVAHDPPTVWVTQGVGGWLCPQCRQAHIDELNQTQGKMTLADLRAWLDNRRWKKGEASEWTPFLDPWYRGPGEQYCCGSENGIHLIVHCDRPGGPLYHECGYTRQREYDVAALLEQKIGQARAAARAAAYWRNVDRD
jgi:hypothetical protein